VSSPTQRALVKILNESDKPYHHFDNYYDFVANQYERKRDDLLLSLQDGHFHAYSPDGGFFIIADTSNYKVPDKYIQQPGPNGEAPVTRDWGFARFIF
jgi:DNA-binding transcriptional MocR family regulator